MSNIKSKVEYFKSSALNDFRKRVQADFDNRVETIPELQVEISTWETCVKKLRVLFDKYSSNYSSLNVHESDLRSKMNYKFRKNFEEEEKKITKQFDIIIAKLKTIKSPSTALNFLKLCGIEWEETEKVVEQIPVDAEFIKSVLPKFKELPAAKE